jgi:hypothetical protein
MPFQNRQKLRMKIALPMVLLLPGDIRHRGLNL